MALLHKASNQMAFAKVGILGFAGAGKTYTASLIAIGLHKHIKSKKPVAFLDTETGSDFVLRLFQEAGIELLVAKSRSFSDLVDFLPEAQKAADIAIIDSITHFWDEVITAFQKKTHISRMEFQHWNKIKPMWREQFSEPFVALPLHILICGRAGYTWDYEKDEEGKKELIKTGIKMRAEGDFGYEPSLVIEMERAMLMEGGGSVSRKAGVKGDTRQVINRAWVIKDRSDLLDGKYFDNPTWDTFKPHFERLSIGGEHHPVDANVKNTEDQFDDKTGDTTWDKEKNFRTGFVEEITNKLTQFYPGQTAIEKQARLNALDTIFGTTSETVLMQRQSDELKAGFQRLCGLLKLQVVARDAGYKDLQEACEKQNVKYADIISGVNEMQAFIQILQAPPPAEIADPFAGGEDNDNEQPALLTE